MRIQLLQDMFTVRTGSKYTAVLESECEENNASRSEGLKDPHYTHQSFELSAKDIHSAWQNFTSACFYYSVTTACLFVVWWLVNTSIDPSTCVNAPVRREWRSLSQHEKSEFIRAFRCLSRTPSSWVKNRTVYDDFAILHGGIGAWCRHTMFLKDAHGTEWYVQQAINRRAFFHGTATRFSSSKFF
jgi:hypothetical protein